MIKLSTLIIVILVSTSLHAALTACPNGEAPITGFAQNFVTDARIDNAVIKVLETGEVYKTNSNGRFSFCQPIGSQITLTLNKSGFHEVQTATYRVSALGFQGPYNEITFQVPGTLTYQLMKFTISTLRKVTLDPKKCTLVTTIAGYHKTLADDPQGEPDATLTLENKNNMAMMLVGNKPYYFGIFNSGPLKGKTNIFTPNLTKTSLDGGVLVYNLNPQSEDGLYTLSAVKGGKEFTRTKIWCRAGALINVSPPSGPTVIQ